jgi:hypothetical protein
MEDYKIDLKCCNCKAPCWSVKIPQGMTIEEFGVDHKITCSRCGCPVIKIKEKKGKEI